MRNLRPLFRCAAANSRCATTSSVAAVTVAAIKCHRKCVATTQKEFAASHFLNFRLYFQLIIVESDQKTCLFI